MRGGKGKEPAKKAPAAAPAKKSEGNGHAAKPEGNGHSKSGELTAGSRLKYFDGQTWLATYNIMPVQNNFLYEVATVEPSPPSREWQFNFTLPADPFPYTLACDVNYIEFHELGLDPERRFVSRTATSNCAVTFVEPAVPGTLEGTFTANLTLRGTSMDYLVTSGRFRLPRAP